MATQTETGTGVKTLIVVEHKKLKEGYYLGRRWLQFGEWEGNIPGSTYLIDNLKWLAKHGMFDGRHDDTLNWYIGFILGMLSSDRLICSPLQEPRKEA